jgi:hypothetical protein
MVKSYKVNLNKDILSISFDYVTEWLNQVQFNFLHFDQSPTPQRLWRALDNDGASNGHLAWQEEGFFTVVT